MDISGVIGIFVSILAASAVLLYIGTIGLRGDEKEDQIQKR